MVVSEKEIFWNIVWAVCIPFFLFPTLLEQEIIVAVQLLSCVQFFATLDCSAPGFSDHDYLPEFAQTHVHESVILFNHLKQEVAEPKSKLSCNSLSFMFQEAQAIRKMGFTGSDKMRTRKEKHLSQFKKDVMRTERLVDPEAYFLTTLTDW